MSDRYARLVNAPLARTVAGRVGLPRPVALERPTDGVSPRSGRALLGGPNGGRVLVPLRTALTQAGIGHRSPPAPDGARHRFLLFDATALEDCAALAELRRFFQPVLGSLERCGRIVVLGTPLDAARSTPEAIAQRALEGFVRSLAKEVGGRGATAQLLLVERGAEHELGSTLDFLLSPASAYVSGQVIRIGAPAAIAPATDGGPERPLPARTALVTGAARGIGRAIAQRLARDSAHVVGVDVPALAQELRATLDPLGGEALELDITAGEAPAALASRFAASGLDVLVHNAGITRDRTLAKMPEERWVELMEVNLCAPERITSALLGHLRPGGAIVCVSSLSAIAGNAGQTNYAASKAGLIGMVQALAPQLSERAVRINAVAPGFIETRMTRAMPLAIREAGRRMNSLVQGGVPQDVAETVAWLASPASAGINGNVIRVCGQSLLGA